MKNNKSLAPSKVTTRDPKGRKFISIVEDAYNKAGLFDLEAQSVNDTPGLASLVSDFIAKNRTPKDYADEEVASNYGYLSGYKKPVEITSQIDILREHWPNLNPDKALKYYRELYPTLQFPNWVEGPFALIRPGFFSDKYGEELEEILKALKKARDGRFVNYCEGKLGSEHLIQTEESLAAMAHIIARQPDSDIIIVPEQFGIRHRGKSVRRAGVYIKNTPSEFGEGAKNTGTMILTHPNRLANFDDLWMDCPGDRYRPNGSDDFFHAPIFSFNDDEVEFRTRRLDRCLAFCGSVSGVLLPECSEPES